MGVAFVGFGTRYIGGWRQHGIKRASNLSISPFVSYSSATWPPNPRPAQRRALALATPEQLARQTIDALLTAAGWTLQDRGQFDRNTALGVAVREFQLPAGPPASSGQEDRRYAERRRQARLRGNSV